MAILNLIMRDKQCFARECAVPVVDKAAPTVTMMIVSAAGTPSALSASFRLRYHCSW
jgi:hypothetical protein